MQHRGIFKIFADQSHVILGMPLTCTMGRNRTRGHAERMHGLGIIWLAPLEACVFIRRRVGAAQLHWITSGNQPPWPELSAKCNPLSPIAPFPSHRYVSCISIVVPRFPYTYFKLPVSVALLAELERWVFCIRPPWMHFETFEFKVCNRDSRAKSRTSPRFWTINYPIVHAM